MMSVMRVVFIGGTVRGERALQALAAAGATLVGIVSCEQHPHETERAEEAIDAFGAAQSVPVFRVKNFSDTDLLSRLRKLKPDIAFIVGCRLLISTEMRVLFPKGCYIVHDSLLPAYRGFAPLHWAILNGENNTGVTLFQMSERMDAGDIVAQKSIPIGPDDDAGVLAERVTEATEALLREQYPRMEAGKAKLIPQDERAATYTCNRVPGDGWIEWDRKTLGIHRQIRALARPFPGAFTWYQGAMIFIWKAEIVPHPPAYVGRVPGRIVALSMEEGWVDVLTGDGILRIVEVQREGEAPVPASRLITKLRSTLGLHPQELLSLLRPPVPLP
jgi:methionyl-tRNA formyltransferase